MKEDKNSISLPTLLYHHFQNENFNDLLISEKKFEENIKYLKENGYNAVGAQDLLSFVYEGKDLPKNPVCITFDDGYESNYNIGFPILKKYGMKAIIFVIGEKMGKANYKNTDKKIIPHFTFEKAKEMENSGLIEIGNHTYDMHQTPKYENSDKCRPNMLKLKNETEEEYKKALENDYNIMKNLLEKNLNKKVEYLAYPIGAYDERLVEILKSLGVKMTFSAESKNNKIIKNNPESLFNIGRYYISEATELDELEKILKGKK